MKWDEWIGKNIHLLPAGYSVLFEKILTSFSLLELDNHYLKYHADKKKRIEERGEKCYGTAPEAMDGAIELLEELYVLQTHPTPSSKY
jgi:hypothetical protein